VNRQAFFSIKALLNSPYSFVMTEQPSDGQVARVVYCTKLKSKVKEFIFAF